VIGRQLRVLDARAGGQARVVEMRLGVRGFWARIVDAHNRSALFTDLGGGATTLTPLSSPVSAAVAGDRIDPAIPERLIATLHRRIGARGQDVVSVSFNAALVGLGEAWSVILSDGAGPQLQFVAALDGSGLRRPGGPWKPS
jgi:hypothetical protein